MASGATVRDRARKAAPSMPGIRMSEMMTAMDGSSWRASSACGPPSAVST
jgi:hypothetical protein